MVLNGELNLKIEIGWCQNKIRFSRNLFADPDSDQNKTDPQHS